MNQKKNFVDEGFELISVIFRLAGNWEYNIGAGGRDGIEYPIPAEQLAEMSVCEHTNGYQLEVAETFKQFAEHEAVLFAKSSEIGFADPFRFAMHIKKDSNKYVFIEDVSSLFVFGWNNENAKLFLPLFNKFYKDTAYTEFFSAHTPYFEELSQKFYNDYYHTVDFDWFGKYIDTSNLRCMLSPSNVATCYATTVNKRIVCALVRLLHATSLIHEFNHSFANPIADKWYDENETFKKWCDDSLTEKMPFYSTGREMGQEYVTHAYHILYEHQHGGDWERAISSVKNAGFENSFPYIREIYDMVLASEKN